MKVLSKAVVTRTSAAALTERAGGADRERMAALAVECLRCGERHGLSRDSSGRVERGECPRCRYLGWADASALSERARGKLRERPLELRRIYALPSSERAA